MIQLPADVKEIIKQLNNAGFQAYAVGGCVRDSLLGIAPEDWDICTSALPKETKRCFSGEKVLETGIQHGTVTVIRNHHAYEITTFRKDGDYKDCRHPKEVIFVPDIKEDLSRRDFTINAMAFHPECGIVDYFDGQKDLNCQVIRCVGESEKRFSEDALRMMRGLRFASVYGFSIHPDTESAMLQKKDLLRFIAAERLQAEFKKLLLGDGAEKILESYAEIVSVIIPEIVPMIGLNQKNPHHCYDVWTHTLKSLSSAPKDITVRLAVLFHDNGKPETFFTDENGIGLFYSHAQAGKTICQNVLRRLKFDNKTVQAVSQLVKYHDVQIPATEKSVKKWLNKLGTEQFERLLEVKKADAVATVHSEAKLMALSEIEKLYHAVLEQNACFTLKNLAVSGSDLIAIGIEEGKEIGNLLSLLLEAVMDNKLENERNTLINYVKNHIKK